MSTNFKNLTMHLKKQVKNRAMSYFDDKTFRVLTGYTGVQFPANGSLRPDAKNLFSILMASNYLREDSSSFISHNSSYITAGNPIPQKDMDKLFEFCLTETGKLAIMTNRLIDMRKSKDVDGVPLIWKIFEAGEGEDKEELVIALHRADIIAEVLGDFKLEVVKWKKNPLIVGRSEDKLVIATANPLSTVLEGE